MSAHGVWSVLLVGGLLLQAAAPQTIGVWRGCNEQRCFLDVDFTRIEIERTETAASFDLERHSAVTVASVGDAVVVRGSAAEPERRFRVVTRTDITYAAIGGGHYLRGVNPDGGLVTLEDGSTWEIHPRVHFEVAEWEPLAGVAIRRAAPEDGFPYELTNLDTDTGVAARYRPR